MVIAVHPQRLLQYALQELEKSRPPKTGTKWECQAPISTTVGDREVHATQFAFLLKSRLHAGQSPLNEQLQRTLSVEIKANKTVGFWMSRFVRPAPFTEGLRDALTAACFQAAAIPSDPTPAPIQFEACDWTWVSRDNKEKTFTIDNGYVTVPIQALGTVICCLIDYIDGAKDCTGCTYALAEAEDERETAVASNCSR